MASQNRLVIKRKLQPVQVKRNTTARVIDRKLENRSGVYMEMVTLSDKSKQIADPFQNQYASSVASPLSLIQPDYNLQLLVQAAKRNSALAQCVDAYVINIESYGFQLEYIGVPGGEDSPASKKEKNTALAFLDTPNGDRSLRLMREQSRRDLEYVGDRYWEIGQDLVGRPTFLEHVPSTTMRITRRDKETTPYNVIVRNPDGSGFSTRQCYKNFRRYVQIGPMGQMVYFKEFGDPRIIDPKDGKVNDTLPVEDQATAIYRQSLYSPGSDYGLPRWLGALPALLGLRESELVNLNFFRENAIPAMAVLISGGALTEESFDKVTTLLQSAKGKDAMNRILVLEAAADDSVSSTDQQPHRPQIEMKPMISERQSDGLFKDYETAAKRKVRSCMRLPAIFTGDSEEYTKATAQSGQRIAESQVFAPERSFFDEFINLRLFPLMGVANWRYRSLGPTAYDPDSLSVMLDRFSKNGAMTPNILIKIANQVLDVQIPAVPVGDKWGDVPFAYSLGLIQGGYIIKGFEEVFSQIHDATVAGTGTGATGKKPAVAGGNKKPATKSEVHEMIAEELHAISADLIAKVNEALDMHSEEAA